MPNQNDPKSEQPEFERRYVDDPVRKKQFFESLKMADKIEPWPPGKDGYYEYDPSFDEPPEEDENRDSE
jgi:hypothetical protein